MTAAEERALLREYLATNTRLELGFAASIEHITALMPMHAERIDQLALDDESNVLAFIKRFEQFEDALHRTLKAIAMIMAYGKLERLAPRDVTREAFNLGILADAEIWADAVRTRNALAHEYPLNPDKRASQVNAAWQSRATLLKTWAAIRRFVDIEGLLT